MTTSRSGRFLLWAAAGLLAAAAILHQFPFYTAATGGNDFMAAVLLFAGIGAAVMWLRLKWVSVRARAARDGWDAIARK